MAQLTCRVMLPLNVTPPSPVVPSTPFNSAFAAVFVSSTSMTVEVSLYFADRPRSWHSKTCKESQLPRVAPSSPDKTVNVQLGPLVLRSESPFFMSTTPAKLISFPEPVSSIKSQRYTLDTPPSKYISRYVSKAAFKEVSSCRSLGEGAGPEEDAGR